MELSLFTHGLSWELTQQPPSQFTGMGVLSPELREDLGPLLPHHRHTQRHVSGLCTDTSKYLVHGAIVRSQGMTRPHGTRIAWVQTRTGLGTRETLGGIWEPFPGLQASNSLTALWRSRTNSQRTQGALKQLSLQDPGSGAGQPGHGGGPELGLEGLQRAAKGQAGYTDRLST